MGKYGAAQNFNINTSGLKKKYIFKNKFILLNNIYIDISAHRVYIMTGWCEYAICKGVTTATTIAVNKLQWTYNDNALTVEMIVEVTRRA